MKFIGRCQANAARIRQSRADSGVVLQVKVPEMFADWQVQAKMEEARSRGEPLKAWTLPHITVRLIVITKSSYEEKRPKL